ncbi:MAG: phosphoribosyltransferase [Anaerolineae bacterium]
MQAPKGPMRRELLTWEDVDKLIDILVGQLREAPGFDALLLITRGGIIPGGMLAEALGIRYVLTAAVRFTDTPGTPRVAVWPEFLQFPGDGLLDGRNTLIVDDVWGSGRTSTAVRGRVEAAGGTPNTCVIHYNPYRSLFTKVKPDFFAAITDAYIVYPWEVDRGTDYIETPPIGVG